MGSIKVTQTRSTIKSPERQKRTMKALGLRNVHQTVELPDNPQVNGMLTHVSHLVKIEKA